MQESAVAQVGAVAGLVAALPMTQPGQRKLLPGCLPQLLLGLSACLHMPPAARQAGVLDIASFEVRDMLHAACGVRATRSQCSRYPPA